ncbi:universal stress protein [Nocardia seriolae]|uniref:Universal stress protein n=1 Tax=Nocardia seriolae TaxID=37332 RepID=A0ABC9YVM9_9NOCA|nr:universal stress protein [Nocardia seriolae]APA98954.1 Universal stress protein [Nocardia seriolae]MTJ64008.1 universal stress protein [Nocardia seriolae]MTJ71324.1 universal stress protein [Nocardia seriolae]MTJ88569.1 universal stress protein [Nocardia seriolae]MTK32553.1 universal stress protein [Nocardia seriolae]
MPETVAPQPNSSPRPIVVAVDGSPTSYRAVAWAAVEAELRRLPLEIVIAYGVEPSREPWTALGVAERAAVHAEAASVPAEATRIARHTVPGETVSVTGAAVDEPVLSALVARSATARMMVVGDRGRGAIRRAVLGSVSSGLARRAECPVAVVHGEPDVERGADGPVVVGVDGTANSLPAVRMAFEEASRRKVPLIAVHAWSDSSGFDLEVLGWDAIRERADLQLSEWLADCGDEFPDVTVERRVSGDTPVRALLEYADAAQLLVVGTHGRGGLGRLALGSVSTALLHAAACPVLVVGSRETPR